MATADRARELLARHGEVRPQPPSDWSGPFALPEALVRFYAEVGPADVDIEGHGNGFALPSLARLWERQAGYRFHGRTGEPLAGWSDDWLVVADCGGDPFILSRSAGAVLHDQHGRGAWGPTRMFPDLDTMAACLAALGAVVLGAGADFTDDDCVIRPEWRARAEVELTMLGARGSARVLTRLGW